MINAQEKILQLEREVADLKLRMMEITEERDELLEQIDSLQYERGNLEEGIWDDEFFDEEFLAEA